MMVDITWADRRNVGHVDQESSVDIAEKQGKGEGRTCKVKEFDAN